MDSYDTEYIFWKWAGIIFILSVFVLICFGIYYIGFIFER